MIALTQKISTEVFTFKAVVAFKLLSRKVCLQTEKTIETAKK